MERRVLHEIKQYDYRPYRRLREKLGDTLENPKYIKPFGELGIKLKKNKQDDFSVFQRKIAIRFFGSAVLSVLIVVANILVPLEKKIGRFHCISLRVLSANGA